MASAHNYSLTGTAALGAAFHLSDKHPSLSILTIDKKHICSGNLLYNGKQNYSSPTCFTEENWIKDEQSGCCRRWMVRSCPPSRQSILPTRYCSLSSLSAERNLRLGDRLAAT